MDLLHPNSGFSDTAGVSELCIISTLKQEKELEVISQYTKKCLHQKSKPTGRIMQVNCQLVRRLKKGIHKSDIATAYPEKERSRHKINPNQGKKRDLCTFNS